MITAIKNKNTWLSVLGIIRYLIAGMVFIQSFLAFFMLYPEILPIIDKHYIAANTFAKVMITITPIFIVAIWFWASFKLSLAVSGIPSSIFYDIVDDIKKRYKERHIRRNIAVMFLIAFAVFTILSHWYIISAIIAIVIFTMAVIFIPTGPKRLNE